MAKRFSERKGIVSSSREIQVAEMSDELRNSLWNVLDLLLWRREGFLVFKHGDPFGFKEPRHYHSGLIKNFSESLWLTHLKLPTDEIPYDGKEALRTIRSRFFSCEWYEVYDFIEWTLTWASSHPSVDVEHLQKSLNDVMETELAGYRFVNEFCTDITSKVELEALEEVLANDEYPGVTSHLQAAMHLLTDRKNPDYRNSIKESISAVESMAKTVTGRKKATLGDALAELEKRGVLHKALKQGFSKLYGYTNDEGGIRHAMLEEPNLTAADAKFFLLSCTSFINYLKAKL